MLEYRRHLPHLIPADIPLFVTWNLKGDIPQEAAARLRAAYELLQRQQRRPGKSPHDRRLRLSKASFAKDGRFSGS